MSDAEILGRFGALKRMQEVFIDRVREYKRTGDSALLPDLEEADRIDRELESIIGELDPARQQPKSVLPIAVPPLFLPSPIACPASPLRRRRTEAFRLTEVGEQSSEVEQSNTVDVIKQSNNADKSSALDQPNKADKCQVAEQPNKADIVEQPNKAETSQIIEELIQAEQFQAAEQSHKADIVEQPNNADKSLAVEQSNEADVVDQFNEADMVEQRQQVEVIEQPSNAEKSSNVEESNNIDLDEMVDNSDPVVNTEHPPNQFDTGDEAITSEQEMPTFAHIIKGAVDEQEEVVSSVEEEEEPAAAPRRRIVYKPMYVLPPALYDTRNDPTSERVSIPTVDPFESVEEASPTVLADSPESSMDEHVVRPSSVLNRLNSRRRSCERPPFWEQVRQERLALESCWETVATIENVLTQFRRDAKTVRVRQFGLAKQYLFNRPKPLPPQELVAEAVKATPSYWESLAAALKPTTNDLEITKDVHKSTTSDLEIIKDVHKPTTSDLQIIREIPVAIKEVPIAKDVEAAISWPAIRRRRRASSPKVSVMAFMVAVTRIQRWYRRHRRLHEEFPRAVPPIPVVLPSVGPDWVSWVKSFS